MTIIITILLNIAAWARELENHPDKEFAQYLLQGISQGFRIGFNYPKECQSAKSNMKSATENPLVIDEYLVKGQRMFTRPHTWSS